MPIKFSDLRKQTLDTVVDLDETNPGKETIAITYLRNFHQQGTDRNQEDILVDALMTWDVTEDDGKTPMPINKETIHGLGTRIQNLIYLKMCEDLLPNRMKASS